MKIFNYTLEVSLGARHNWSHFKIHRDRDGYYKHLVWGKLSIIWGQPHLVPVLICGECDSDEIGGVSAGDEGWTVCRSCRSIEGKTYYITTEEWEKKF